MRDKCELRSITALRIQFEITLEPLNLFFVSAILIQSIHFIVNFFSIFLSIDALLHQLSVSQILNQFFFHCRSGCLNCVTMGVREACYWFYMETMVVILLLGGVSLGLDVLNVFTHQSDLFFFVSDSLFDLVFDIVMNI